MRTRLRPEADEEIEQAARWYQQQSGLGEQFLTEVVDALLEVERHPQRYPAPPGLRSKREIRRLMLPRFPYSIVYEIRSKEILVLACAHQRRRPMYWRARLT